jgi:hypothetical protein
MDPAAPRVNGRMPPFMSETGRRRLGWVAIALVVLLAVGGAARTPHGIRLGLPGALAAVAGLALAGVALRRAGVDARVLAGLLVVPALLVLVPRSAAAGALSGPPLAAVAIAGLWAAGLDLARLRRAFVPAVAVLYALVSVQVQRQVGPQGDEPHYLMVADSLLRDGDVSLEADYREGRYAPFFTEGLLEPHFRVRGRHGEVYSTHALGLSLLVLPAYAASGYPAVSLFMALLAAITAVLVRDLVAAVLDEASADIAGWLVALSPPLVHYAGLVFTEVPAALVTALVLREALRARDTSMRRAFGVGLALAFLPWLNVRYAIVAAILGLFWVSARPAARSVAAFAAPGVLSLLAIGAYHHALYGFYDPRRVYGRHLEFALDTLKEGLPGLLLDQEFGLLVYAPIFVLALPGVSSLLRRHVRLGVAVTTLVAAVFFTAGTWHMWRGGFNPPARFLVPIVPALALAAAAWLGKRRWAGAALLLGWGVFTGLAGAADPHLVHRDRDGTAPLFRARSGATEWARLLPSYVLAERDRHSLALLWAMALAAAAMRSRSETRARSVAGALLAWALAAEAASRISDARSGGREATHVLRRMALDWPRLRVGRAPAEWSTADLTWGPVYEPHRHSGVASVAERLSLAPGRYRVAIHGEILGAASTPPTLIVLGRERRVVGTAACSVASTGWICEVVNAPGNTEISMVLKGGSPLRGSQIQIE